MVCTRSQFMIAVLLLFTGCVGERKEQDAEVDGNRQQPAVVDRDQELTAEIVKRALLEMEWKGRVPPPKDEPIEFVNADKIAIGEWKCNLKEKTFHASSFHPQAERHKLNEVDGVFQRTAEGTWVAKVTETSSSH